MEKYAGLSHQISASCGKQISRDKLVPVSVRNIDSFELLQFYNR